MRYIRCTPGARRESVEAYIKRNQSLRRWPRLLQCVAETYAFSAREIRIIVKPEQIDDLAAIQLSKDIAKAVRRIWNIRDNQGHSHSRNTAVDLPNSGSTEEGGSDMPT